MTNITYTRTNERFHLTAQGHAGYGPKGTDIVCAAVSIILQSVAEYALESNVLEVVNLKLQEGDGDIDIRGESECFDMALIGLEMIAETYPENVQMAEIKALSR